MTNGSTRAGMILLASLAALSLSGCVKFAGKAPPQLLNLTAATGPVANESRMAGAGQAIVIAIPGAPQAIATNRVAVNDGPVTVAYVKDAFWVEPPARLFQRLLTETVGAKTGKVVLDTRQFAMEPGVILSGQLRSFGIDAQAGKAVVVYDAAMSRDKGKTVTTRRFEASEPVAVVDALSSGRALNRAANRVADEVADWVK
jgi:cholesterol transport system auxiliary component